MSHIFISYSRRDLGFAQKIVDALAANELDTWIDWKSIPKGEDWEQEIYRGIEEADAFLFLISPDSVASEMCNREIAHAVKNGKRILPIFISKEDPGEVHKCFYTDKAREEISKRNYIFCRGGQNDFTKAIEETHKTIHTDYEWLKYHTELQVKALKWEQKKDTSRLLRGKELREAEQQLAEVGAQEDPQPTKIQRQYIFASKQKEDQIRSRTAIGLSIGFIVVLGIAIVAVIQWQRAERQTKVALARQLAAQAQSIFATGNSKQMEGVLLAVQSMNMLPSTEAALVLQNNTLMPTLSNIELDGWVKSVAFSPDGRYIVAGSADTARVWEARTGKEIAKVIHGWDVNSVAFSPDGKYVVSGSDDNTVRVWETVTGKEVARMTHEGKVLSVIFSPDKRYVISGGEDGTARVWEARTGKAISKVKHDGWVVSLAISPDSRYVLSADGDSTARAWELATGKEIAKMVHESGVYVVAFNPDGQLAVSSGCDKRDKPGHCIKSSVRVWETSTGREISRMAHDDLVKSVAFSPNGMYVVSGSWDCTARVWEVRTGKEIANVTHDDWVNSVAFSSDGKYIISGSNDSTARVWEAATGKEIGRVTHEKGDVYSVAFSRDGNLVVSGGYENVRVWEIILNKEVTRMIHAREVNSVAFRPDGMYVASGSKDGIVHVWDTTTGTEMFHMNSGDDDVFSVAYSSDGRYIVTGGCNQYHGGDLCDLGTVRILEVATGQEIAQMTHEGVVYSVAFSPGGNYVVSGGQDSARVWETFTGKEITRLTDARGVRSVAFSRNGQYIVTGSFLGIVQVWEVATGKEVSHIINYEEVWAVAFGPDEKTVASGGPDGTVRLLEVTTSKEIARKTIVNDRVTSVVFSPDGQYIAFGNTDGTVRVWETATGAEIVRMMYDGGVNSVAFSNDGKYLVAGGADKTARVWMWRPNDLINKACSHITRNLTSDEWENYVGEILPYQAVCPNLPIGPEITITPTP
jgi:uncharacterized delta-60 repeat protein